MIFDLFINKFIAANYNSATSLKPLDGKVIGVQCTDFAEYTLYLHCEVDRMHTTLAKPENVDCLIAASLDDFVGLLLKQSVKLSIDGDVELAAALKKFILTLDIDLEEQLAVVTGDIVAHKLNSGISKVAKYCVAGVKDLVQMSKEYMQYETDVLPSKQEFAVHNQEVHELRLAVDRLQARIKAYEVI